MMHAHDIMYQALSNALGSTLQAMVGYNEEGWAEQPTYFRDDVFWLREREK